MAISMKDYATSQQDALRQGFVDLMWQSSRVMSRLNFIQHRGLSYPYSKRTKRPGVATRTLNQDFQIAPGNYAPDTETLCILGGEVRTDTVLQQFKPTLRENEIAGTAEAAGLMFDRLFFKGDPSKPGGVNEFYGLYPRITGAQVIDMATNGAVVTHEKVSELLDLVKGPNSEKVLAMNRTNRRLLSHDVKDNAGGKGVFDVSRQLLQFDDANIWEIEKDESDNEILPFNETQGGSNVASSILCFRPGGAVDERDVQGIMGMDIQVNPSERRGVFLIDVIQMVGGIGIFGGYAVARLRGCLAA